MKNNSINTVALIFYCFACLVAPGLAIFEKPAHNLAFPSTLGEVDLAAEPPTLIREKIHATLSGIVGLRRNILPRSDHSQHNHVESSKTSINKRKFGPLSLLRSGGGNMKKKLLILMSDTGGGHRASAQALDQAIQERYPGKIDVNIMDIWTDHGKWPFNKCIPAYRFLAKRPLLWSAFYSYGLFTPTRLFTEFDSHRLCYKGFQQAIENANPDFVVSVHPLCQLMPLSIVREMNKKRPTDKPRIPFVTVVTDLGSAHPCWFDKRADAVYVPSEAVRDIALRNNIPSRKILLKGLPIRPSFWRQSPPKNIVRRLLGLAQYHKTVLLMGGGDGVGGLGSIASEVASRLSRLAFPTQLVVVCGHNNALQQQLTQKLLPTPRQHINKSGANSNTMSKYSPLRFIRNIFNAKFTGTQDDILHKEINNSKLKVVVKGFVSNVDELMGASDLLVTKAGPGTIAEAMTRGLPLILSSYLPGQVNVFTS